MGEGDEEEEEEEEEEDHEEGEDGGGETSGVQRPKPRPVEPFLVSDAALEAHALLVAGEAVPAALTLELIRQRIASPTVQHRGYVWRLALLRHCHPLTRHCHVIPYRTLRAVSRPANSWLGGCRYVLEACHDEGTTSEPAVAQLAVQALWELSIVPEYLIELVAADEDRAARIATRRLHPVTGAEILKENVVGPIEGPGADGDEEEEEVEEDPLDEDGDEEEEEEGEQDPVEEAPPATQVAPVPSDTLAAYDAAVSTPTDVKFVGSGAFIESDLDVDEIAVAYAKTFLGPYRLKLDDTLPIDTVVSSLLFSLERRSIPPIKEVLVLDPVDDDPGVMTTLRASNLPDPDSPIWNLSRFGAMCPVSLVETGKAVFGLGTYVIPPPHTSDFSIAMLLCFWCCVVYHTTAYTGLATLGLV
jgi:hypothetical protein